MPFGYVILFSRGLGLGRNGRQANQADTGQRQGETGSVNPVSANRIDVIMGDIEAKAGN